MTTYRKLTLAEIYPLAHQQDLLKKQSEHFVNKIISIAIAKFVSL